MKQTRVIFLIIQILLCCFKNTLIVVGIALLTNLYKQALIYEDGHSFIDPEKEGIQ